jgi:uncharacterized membrane protein
MMAGVTVVTGGVLIAIGVIGWWPHRAGTALIPAYMGAVLVLLGLLAFKDALRKHAMHAAALVGSLGFLVCAVMGWPKLFMMTLFDSTVERPAAVYSQSATAAVLLVFVLLCVNSFVQARRRRRQAEAATEPRPAA